MDQFIAEHWSSIATILISAITALATGVAYYVRSTAIWVSTDIIKPLVAGHLDFMNKTVQEQQMQSDILAKTAETSKKTTEILEGLLVEVEKQRISNETKTTELIAALAVMRNEYSDVCRVVQEAEQQQQAKTMPPNPPRRGGK